MFLNELQGACGEVTCGIRVPFIVTRGLVMFGPRVEINQCSLFSHKTISSLGVLGTISFHRKRDIPPRL